MVFSLNRKYRLTEGTSLAGGKEMGFVYAEIELINCDDVALQERGMLRDTKVRKTKNRALVDTGALDLVINEEAQRQLGLRVLHQRTIWLADESTREVDMVGPVEVRFANRSTIVKAIVLPVAEYVLLGAIPLEGLDVYIDPVQERLIVNPKSPNIRSSQVKRVA
jgi:clan AA aspartic protease